MPLAAGRPAPTVEAAIMDHVAAMNNRYTPKRPKIYEAVSKEHTAYIFNVGPWAHKRELGSAGTFFIPARADDEPYSKPLCVEGVIEEPYPKSETENTILYTDGESLIGQIIGIGPHVAPRASLVPFGVFVSPTIKPPQALLDKAFEELVMKYMELVREAGDCWANNRDKDQIIQVKWHHVAARALKKTDTECPWMSNSVAPEERKNCPSCGTIYVEGVAECAKCGDILDVEKYRAKLKRIELAKGISKN